MERLRTSCVGLIYIYIDFISEERKNVTLSRRKNVFPSAPSKKLLPVQ
jgi:hypothetical protein